MNLVPHGPARMYNIIPYEVVDGRLGVVAADPLSYKLHDELQYVLNCEVYVLVAVPENVMVAVDHFYPIVVESTGSLLDDLAAVVIE